MGITKGYQVTTVYLSPEQAEKLKTLSSRTKVSQANYIRQGIDEVIRRSERDGGGPPDWSKP